MPPRDETDEDAHRPSVVRVLRTSVADAWAYLPLLVGLNVAWILLLASPAAPLGVASAAARRLSAVAEAAGLGLIIAAVAAGNAALFHVTNRIARHDAAPADLWRGLRHFVPSLGLTAASVAVWSLCATSVYFYTRIAHGTWSLAAAMLAAYLALMYAAAMTYAYPLLVQQRCGVWSAMRLSALLCADNLSFTGRLLLAALAAACTLGLLIASGAPWLVGLAALPLCFFAAGFAALVANNAVAEVMRKYHDTER